jgi:hypothetical protein
MLDQAADAILDVYRRAMEDPEWAHGAPYSTPWAGRTRSRPRRHPVLR